MSKTIGQVEREITDLEREFATLAKAIFNAYQEYLSNLGKIARQQVILASYYICTQAYPSTFLDLSLNQRQQLQQSLLTLANLIPNELLNILNGAPQSQLELEPETASAVVDDFLLERETTNPVDAFSVNEVLAVQLADASADDFERITPVEIESSETGSKVDWFDPRLQHEQLNPNQIEAWLNNLERAIAACLHRFSGRVNQLLQHHAVLPPNLPESLLEIFAKADIMSDTMTGPPNILSIPVEALQEVSASKKSTSDSAILFKNLPDRLVSLRLNLADIEFLDATVAASRTTIRNLSTTLLKRKQVYQKRQQECIIIAAETAWRASWFED
jgi:adenine-specific DNA methylase